MKTVPLTDPKKGMLIFSEDRGLMARITSVKADGFGFHVENGRWDGEMTAAGLKIDAPNGTEMRSDVAKDTFRRVTALTKAECDQWYVEAWRVKHLIREDADIDDRISDDARVYQAQLTLTVMGQDASAEAFTENLRSMGPQRILREMDQGEFLGQITYGAAEWVEAGQVAHRATALGSDETFFPEFADLAAAEPADAAGRILRAQMDQGLSNEGLEAASRAFIERMGLSHAYATFLESGEALQFEDPEGFDTDDDMTPY